MFVRGPYLLKKDDINQRTLHEKKERLEKNKDGENERAELFFFSL